MSVGLSLEERLYREMVDEAFAHDLDKSFSNGKSAHAIYLIEKFFSHAQSTIRLYSGTLARHWKEDDGGKIKIYASSNLIGSVLTFLRKDDTRLDIVVDQAIDVEDGDSVGDHPLLKAIGTAEPPIRGTVRVFVDRRYEPPEDVPRAPHFMVIDRKGFRIETDPDKAEASANVNDVPLAIRIANFFDRALVAERETTWSHQSTSAKA